MATQKKLFYFSTTTLPNSRSHSVQIMNMCHEFAKECEVVLYVGGQRASQEAIFKRYHLEENFSIKILVEQWKGYARYITQVISVWRIYRTICTHKPDYVYIREPIVAFLLSFLTNKFFFEIHTLSTDTRRFMKRIARNVQGIISTNVYKKDWLVEHGYISSDKITVAHNGVPSEMYERVTDSKNELRKELGLPTDSVLVGYIGRFTVKGRDKNVRSLLKPLSQIQRSDVSFMFGGATPDELTHLGEEARKLGIHNRVIGVPYIKQHDMPKYLKALDYLLLTYPPLDEHLKYFMSPLKVGEYMASGTPMVVSDLPALREVLAEDMVYYFDPYTDDALVGSLEDAVSHPDEARLRGVRAYEASKKYSWSTRARTILDFMAKHT